MRKSTFGIQGETKNHPDTRQRKGGRCKSFFSYSRDRASFGAFLGEGAWVDLWRSQNPGLRRYTYWSQRFMKARIDNLGWRLDYFVVSQNLAAEAGKSYIRDLVKGSDHCPIVLCMKKQLIVNVDSSNENQEE
eukprot:Gregarina_sp_Poly_1__6091@NODE_3211_length_1273_cov_192_579602_g2041_i0_p2_GENE_NODE_3211_length_1273_cov_192_579602_g2041_i0NODE_3211_length_1273_cov_192_579602_g2041_i0_p2_ORF_typecomplete_len133_score11_63Exo_endo_phos/PF03372_23/0_00016Exo_endo_phos_2/PF14529_6/0_014_NODE_3211_length_1273_cov_192_579602_g2041_i08621260